MDYMIKSYNGDMSVFEDLFGDYGIINLTLNLIAPRIHIHPFFDRVSTDDDIEKLRFLTKLKHIIHQQIPLLVTPFVQTYHHKTIRVEGKYGFTISKDILEEDIGIFSPDGLLYPPLVLFKEISYARIAFLFTIVHYPVLLMKIKNCVLQQFEDECYNSNEEEPPCWEAIDGECPDSQFKYFFDKCSDKLDIQDFIDDFEWKIGWMPSSPDNYDAILNKLVKINYFSYLQKEYPDAFTKITLFGRFSCGRVSEGECLPSAHFCQPIDFTNYFENRFKKYLSLLNYLISVSDEYLNMFGYLNDLSLLSDLEPLTPPDITIDNNDISNIPTIKFYTIFSKIQPTNCEVKKFFFR